MYIKRVLLDGFKSYAKRTEISGWDPVFNAITGFNGTGKSNILDAICWVMGISKTERMRVQNQKQLIYKEGQTRVTKASVTVVFDNTDKDRSPIGYQGCSEITVTRVIHVQNKNKYYINGANAQAARVRDLFHSVSLDVNNPHFLIMQGMVTKVLNYGDKAILGMIEEAAGTKMYMEKKCQAEKTMREKNLKMEEIQKILQEQINPQLNKLRTEKRNYQKYQQNQILLGKNNKKIVAVDYHEASKDLDKVRVQVSSNTETIAVLKRRTHEIKGKIETEQGEIEVASRQLSMEGQKGLIELQNQKRTVMSEQAKVEEKFKFKKKATKKAEKSLKNEEKTCEELQQSLAEAVKKFNKVTDETKDFNEEIAKLEEAISRAENAKLGIDSGDAHGSLEAQLIAAKKSLSDNSHKLKSSESDKKSMAKEIKDKRNQAKNDRSSWEKHSADEKRVEAMINACRRDVERFKFDENQLNQLQNTRDMLEPQRDTCYQQMQKKKDEARRFDLKYDKRVLGNDFPHNEVHDRLLQLVKIPPKFHSAIHAIGKGNLFAVVVDTVKTASDMLHKKAFRHRTTLFALERFANKRGLPDQQWQRARQIGQCYNAEDFVECDEKYKGIIRNYFGRWIICEDKHTAQLIMNQVHVSTVSLDGTTYTPMGEVAGGSKAQQDGPLEVLYKLKDFTSKYNEICQKFQTVDSQWNQLRQKAEQHERTSDKLEKNEHQLIRIKKLLKNSQYQRLTDEANETEKQLQELLQNVEKIAADKQKDSAEVKKLQKTINDFKKNRAAKIKEMDDEIKANRKKRKGLETRKRKEEKRVNELTAKKKAAEDEVKEKEDELTTLKANLAKAQDEEKSCEEEVEKIKESIGKIEDAIKEEKDKIASKNKEIGERKAKVKELEEQVHKTNLEVQEKEQDLEREKKLESGLEKRLDHLAGQNPWVEEEKEKFGVEGGDYDFSQLNITQLRERQAHLEAEQARLDRQLNKKVMHMLDSAEREFKDLKRKKDVVIKDKEKIENVIRDLDNKKAITLQECFVAVNTNFSKIFAMLLKGSRAKLKAVNEDDGLESGIEIKVAFGETWKESLSELSGGQRSLLALSLILAIAAKNPAPIYILDEIDAALDPSHTQNIGLMLQRQFKQSQFIIVSLKDGMFENANVLFRTEFVDGVSQVRKVRGFTKS